MKIIPQTSDNYVVISNSVSRFSKRYRIGSILKACNAYKSKGFAVVAIFEYLVGLVFSNRSMYMNFLTNHDCPELKKDTVYRFLNSSHINWQKLTAMLASSVSNGTVANLTSATRKNVFIIDDTIFERQRSKKVELLSRVYDHAKHCYKKGFRLLSLGWSDGNTFIPVAGSLLASSNEKNLLSPANKMIDKRSHRS